MHRQFDAPLKRRTADLLCGIAVSVLLASTVFSAEKSAGWPQFLGPDRNGLSAETGLLDSFPPTGPPLVWRVPGGVGMSGLAVSQGKVVTMVQRGGKQWVIALDANSGKQLWQTAVASAYRNGMGDGPRATPTIAGNTVFALTGDGILVALNLKDGTKKWTQNPLQDFGGGVSEYGMACSPLVAGDLVVVTPGAKGAAVVAYYHKTGKLAWKTGRGTAGYSSPALLNVGGKKQIVAFIGKAAVGIDPKSGASLW
ncbi:MAG: PQQ-like beta-propeller repeat protein, partial [Planctomycetes bacterium]|nr:PQQ-like beta-propeller repeat protein [Planctomycetota bacterium]